MPQTKPGGICHIEMPAPDLQAAREFYGGLFGWTFEELGPSYMFFTTPDGDGGGLDADMAPSEVGTTIVLAVEDVDAKLAEIEAAGGRTIKPKTEIGGGNGYYAYFGDPGGNRVGIWMPRG